MKKKDFFYEIGQIIETRTLESGLSKYEVFEILSLAREFYVRAENKEGVKRCEEIMRAGKYKWRDSSDIDDVFNYFDEIDMPKRCNPKGLRKIVEEIFS